MKSRTEDVLAQLKSDEDQQIKFKAARCRRSFAYFVKEFWSVIATTELEWNWHIDVFVDELTAVAERVVEGRQRDYDLLFNVPPGTSKSTVISILFPAWCWTNWRQLVFICASYNIDLALDHAEMCRTVVQSQKYQAYFPDVSVMKTKEKKSHFEITPVDTEMESQKGGARISTSVGGSITGRHAHIIIVDDPLDPRGAASTKERIDALNWFDVTLPSRQVNKDITTTILVMQRLHEDDPSGHMLEQGTVRHICLPGETIEYGDNVRPKELSEKYTDGYLDPKRLGPNALGYLKNKLGPFGYASQIGQSPAPPEGGEFNLAMLGILEELPDDLELGRRMRYWDKAATDKAKQFARAHTCGALLIEWKKSATRTCWIYADIVRGQWGIDQRNDIIMKTANRDGRGTMVRVEQEPGSSGIESTLYTVRSLAGYNVSGDRPTGDKLVRAGPLASQMAVGDIYILKAHWNKDWLNEFRFFPYSKQSDQVDACSAAFNLLTQKKKIRIIV